MSTVRVMYVGKKARQTDTVAGTSIVWSHQGDVRSVPLAAWSKMAKHPDVWALDEGSVPVVDRAIAAAGLASLPTHAALQGTAVVEPVLDSDLPADIEIVEGVSMPRDEVVRGAFQALVFGAKEWNELTADQRAEMVDAHVERLRETTPAVSEKPQGDFKDGAGAAQEAKVNLMALDKDALKALAAERQVKVHPNAGEDKLRAALVAAGV
jgi:hypothetical protein